MFRPFALAALTFTAGMAHADLSITFNEGAPKDSFALTNVGSCALGAAEITLDLGAAPADLIFDVTQAGAGVEVFQPFEVIAGATHLRALPQVRDGQSVLTLELAGLAAGDTIAFTIDIDDTAGGREITVNGSEIAGALVRLDMAGTQSSAAFDETATARIQHNACQT